MKSWKPVLIAIHAVPLSPREYNFRLDQVVDAIYDELSQLPLIDSEIVTSPTQDLMLVNKDPVSTASEKPKKGDNA